MYQNLLREWIKTIPSKSNREYIKNSQEMVYLQVFAEWLDKQAAEHRLHTDGATGCAVCGSTNPNVHFTEPHRFTGTPRR